MTVKEFNALTRAFYNAALENEEIAQMLGIRGRVAVLELHDKKGQHGYCVSPWPYIFSREWCEKNNYDQHTQECRTMFEINHATKNVELRYFGRK